MYVLKKQGKAKKEMAKDREKDIAPEEGTTDGTINCLNTNLELVGKEVKHDSFSNMLMIK